MMSKRFYTDLDAVVCLFALRTWIILAEQCNIVIAAGSDAASGSERSPAITVIDIDIPSVPRLSRHED